MSRPTIVHVGGTLTWEIMLYDATGSLVDADSLPTISVRRNGSPSLDVVTPVKRDSTTGIYDCTYTPGALTEGERITIEESATIGSTVHLNPWHCVAIAVERGTNGANTVAPATPGDLGDLATYTQLLARTLPAADYFDPVSHVVAQVTNVGTVAALADDAITADTLDSTAVNILQSGLATSSAVATLQSGVTTLLDRVSTTVVALWANLVAMITGTGVSAKFTSTALSNAPSGGSGGSPTVSAFLLPAMIQRLAVTPSSTISLALGEFGVGVEHSVIDADREPVPVEDATHLIIRTHAGELLQEATIDDGLTVADNVFTFVPTAAVTAELTSEREMHYWSLRSKSETHNQEITFGRLFVRFSAN